MATLPFNDIFTLSVRASGHRLNVTELIIHFCEAADHPTRSLVSRWSGVDTRGAAQGVPHHRHRTMFMTFDAL